MAETVRRTALTPRKAAMCKADRSAAASGRPAAPSGKSCLQGVDRMQLAAVPALLGATRRAFEHPVPIGAIRRTHDHLGGYREGGSEMWLSGI